MKTGSHIKATSQIKIGSHSSRGPEWKFFASPLVVGTPCCSRSRDPRCVQRSRSSRTGNTSAGAARISVQASRSIAASNAPARRGRRRVFGEMLANVGDESGWEKLHLSQHVNQCDHVDIACESRRESCGPNNAPGGPGNWCYSPPALQPSPHVGEGNYHVRLCRRRGSTCNVEQ